MKFDLASSNSQNVRWHYVCLGLALLTVGWLLGSKYLNDMHDQMRVPRCKWYRSDRLGISLASDGPVVITHLEEAETRNRAALTPALLINDSEGATLSAEALSKLVWQNFRGEHVHPPRPGSALRLYYYWPQKTERPADPAPR